VQIINRFVIVSLVTPLFRVVSLDFSARERALFVAAALIELFVPVRIVWFYGAFQKGIFGPVFSVQRSAGDPGGAWGRWSGCAG
jgi:hypothetical protein